jgi:hypothetical protein
MNATEHRERILNRLLDEIEDADFPNTATLNRIESSLHTHDAISRYTEALAKKVEVTRYPSAAMVNRLHSALDRLEQAEQRQHDPHRQRSDEG